MTDEELQQLLLQPAEADPAVPAPADPDAALQAELLQPVVDAPPQPTRAADGRVYVVSPLGNLGTVDEAELPTLGEGYQLASRDRVAKQIEAEEYGDVGSQIGAGLEGVAQGATLGAYDAVASLADEGYDRERRLRAEYNPGTALAGEVVGAVAPALLSGGTGAVGSAARLLPAAVEANLGAKLAAHLGSKAAGWGAGRTGALAARVVATGLESATDAALRQVLDEAANGDVDVTAERMLDSAWDGLTTGAALELGMAGLGAAARGGGRAGKKLFGALSESTPTVADDALSQAAAAAPPGALSPDQDTLKATGFKTDDEIVGELSFTPTNTEQVAALEQLNKMGKQAAAARDFEVLQQGKTTEWADALNEAARTQDELNRYLNKSKKLQTVKDMLSEEGTVWSPQHAAGVMSRMAEIRAAARELKDSTPLLTRTESLALKGLNEALDSVEKHVTGLAGTGPISPSSRVLRGDLDAMAETFMALDNLKTRMGALSRTAGRNTDTVTAAEAAIQREYMNLRADLQDAGMWGKRVAEMQTITNAAESEGILKGRVFANRFVKAEGLQAERAGEHGFDTLSDIDRGKLGAMISNLGRAENADAERDFLIGIQRILDWQKAKAQFYRVPTALREKLAQSEAIVSRIAADMRSIKATKSMADEYASQVQQLRDVPFVGEHLAKIKLTSGKAIRMLQGPSQPTPPTVMGRLADGAAKAQQRVTSAADSLVKRVLKPESAKAVREAAVITSARVIQRAIDRSLALQDPNSRESQQLDASLSDIAQDDPALADALRSKVRERADFIASKLRQPTDPTDPLGIAPGPMDAQTARTGNRYVIAAMNPHAALERLSDGKGTPEDLETLKALTPRLYQVYVQRVMERVQRLKRPPTVRERRRIGHTLGVPMDRASRPEAVAWFQGLKPPQGQQSQHPSLAPVSPPQRKRSDVDRRDQVYASRTDAILSGD